MRGFFAGGFWGLVVGGVAVTGASLVNPPPKLPQVAVADEPAPENTREIDSDPGIETGDGPAIEPPKETAASPQTPAAETPVDPDSLPTPIAEPDGETSPAIDTAEAPLPDSAAQEDAVSANGSDPAVEPVQNTDSAPNDAVEIGQEDAPTGEEIAPPVADQTISEPEQPQETDAPAPVVAVEDTLETPPSPDPVVAEAVEPDTLAAAETTPATAPVVADTATLESPETLQDSGTQDTSAEAPVAPAAQPPAPEAPAADQAVDPIESQIEEPTVTADAPQAEAAPHESSDLPILETTTDSTPLTPQAPLSPATPEAGDTAPGRADSVQTAQADTPPVVSVLPGGTNGVRVNRLTGDDENEEAESEAIADEDATSAPEVDEDAPAVLRYAAPAENPDELPELSVVLADDGSFGGGIAAVAGLPFPVSVMLSPSIPNVEDRMAAYRAAGVEVGMLVNLPPAATASDVAIYFEAAMSNMPEAFAILDATGDTQSDSDVIRQTISVLSEDGQGLITVPRGLNTAPRVAADAGVAAGVIFRDLDGEGQDARTIQRFMDQAAFRAGQTPGIILLGRVRPDTISALTRWGAQSSRAGQVAVVPASAALTADE